MSLLEQPQALGIGGFSCGCYPECLPLHLVEDAVQRFDPDVVVLYQKEKKKRHAGADKVAAMLGLKAQKMEAIRAAFDPTDGDVWELAYYFEKDGEQINANLGDSTPFYAENNGRSVDLKTMLADGWELLNEFGIAIDIIAEKIKHKVQK